MLKIERLQVNTGGNKKLVNNANARFMIWNLPAVITCPYRTAHCESSCYALKAEKQYKTCLPFRSRNLDETRRPDFATRMIATIQNLLESRMYRGRVVYFRIHESGDFYNQAYFDKWLDVCKHFEHNPQIRFLAYTKSVKYLQGRTLPENFIVRFSLWDDTKPEQAALAKALDLPTYTADNLTEKEQVQLGDSFCPCKDCATCGKCYDRKIKHIVCQIH